MSKVTTDLVKRTLQVGIEGTANYTTIRVDEQAVFQDICNQVALKQVTKKDVLMFFRIVIRFFGGAGQSRIDYIPSPFERVLQVLDHEQSSWSGEAKLLFRDVRNFSKYSLADSLSPTTQSSSSVLQFLGSGSAGSSATLPTSAGSNDKGQSPASGSPQTQNSSSNPNSQTETKQNTALDSGRIVFDGGCTEFLIGEKSTQKLAEARESVAASSTNPQPQINLSPVVATVASTSADFSRYLGLIGTELSAENTIFKEIENIGTMYGRLEKKLHYREGWRTQWCIVDEDRFWYSRLTSASETSPEYRYISYIDLDLDTKVELESDTSHVFSIIYNANMSRIQFKAPTRLESELWVRSIKNRLHATSENEFMAHAELHASVEEDFAAREDVQLICDCSSLEGTLKNPATRDRFQEYLTEEHSEEYLLFWEHCEDYYSHHPATRELQLKKRTEQKDVNDSIGMMSDDEDAEENNGGDVAVLSPLFKSSVGIRHWATSIYNNFIRQGSAHEVSMSSADRQAIERCLDPQTTDHGKTDSADKPAPSNIIFRQAQNKVLSFIRTSMWTRFVDKDNFRKMLSAIPYNARKHFRDMNRLRINILMDKNRLNHSLTLPVGRGSIASLRVTFSSNEKGLKDAAASNSSLVSTVPGSLPSGNVRPFNRSSTLPVSPPATISDRFFKLFKRKNANDMEVEWNRAQDDRRKSMETSHTKKSLFGIGGTKASVQMPSIEFGWKGNLWWDRVEFDAEEMSQLDVSPIILPNYINGNPSMKPTTPRSFSAVNMSTGLMNTPTSASVGNSRFMKVYPSWAPRSVRSLDNALKSLASTSSYVALRYATSSVADTVKSTEFVNPLESESLSAMSAFMSQNCDKCASLSERLKSKFLTTPSSLSSVHAAVQSIKTTSSVFVAQTPFSRRQKRIYEGLIDPELSSSTSAFSPSAIESPRSSSVRTPFRRSIPKFIGPFENDYDSSSQSKRPTSDSQEQTVNFNKRSGRALQLMRVSTKGLVVTFGWMKCAYVRGAINAASSGTPVVQERQLSSPSTSPKQFKPEEKQKQLEQVIQGDEDEESKLRAAFASILQVASSEYQRKFAILTDFLGTGELHLFDPEASVPVIIIKLQCASRVGVFEGQLHSIQIIDETPTAGGISEDTISWILCCEGTDEDDAHSSCKRWIEQLAPYTLHSDLAVRILLEGIVSKRGKINTGYKKRWMVLSSNFRLFYYKEETGGLKGEIQISDISEVKDIGKDFSITTPLRVWQMSTDSSTEAKKWVSVLSHIMSQDKRASLQSALAGLNRDVKKDWNVVMS